MFVAYGQRLVSIFILYLLPIFTFSFLRKTGFNQILPPETILPIILNFNAVTMIVQKVKVLVGVP